MRSHKLLKESFLLLAYFAERNPPNLDKKNYTGIFLLRKGEEHKR
jgi:hypothetical protein